MKIALVCSHGGHLTEMLHLINAFRGNEFFFITYDNPRTRALPFKKYLFPNFGEKPLKIIRNIPIFLSILKNEKPNIIISNGAEIAIPFFYLAKIFGIKSLFIETYTRVDLPTVTGRIVYPIASRFFILWSELKQHYGRRAEYHGGMFNSASYEEGISAREEGPIFAIVGMHYQGFERLVRQLDEIAPHINSKIIVQIGNTNYQPVNVDSIKFLASDEMENYILNASIVICQGAMSIIDCLLLGKRVVAVPRLYKFGEVMNDHQFIFSMKLKELAPIDVITDIQELEKCIMNSRVEKKYNIALNEHLVDVLKASLITR